MEVFFGGDSGRVPQDTVENTFAMINMGAIFFMAIVGLTMVIFSMAMCRFIAKSRNLSPAVMWFGLLGIMGIIIVLILPAKKNYNPYDDKSNMKYFNDNSTYYNFGMDNGGFKSSNTLNCPYCGAEFELGDSFCGKCGNRVN